jgi:hypothetical protein
MLQWVTFSMALFSTVLWCAVLAFLLTIRRQVQASRAMIRALGTLSPIVATSYYSDPYVAADSIIDEGGTGNLDPAPPEA